MNLTPELTPGFSATNAKICAYWAARAYDGKPDFVGLRNTSVVIADLHDVFIVAFQGTHTAGEWLTDMEAFWKRLETSSVHFGFWAALASVISEIECALTNLNFSPAKPVIFTGHSLGGALAKLAAFRFAQQYPLGCVHSVYTFGQPRVGDARFAQIYNALQISTIDGTPITLHDQTFRFVNLNDIVPRTPFLWPWFNYRHCGREILFDAFGGHVMDPVRPLVLLSDMVGLYRVYTNRRDVLLSDHFLAQYTPKVNDL